MKSVLGLLFLCLLPIPAWAQTVHIEMTREEVEALLGKPRSVLERGDTEHLLYPGGAKVEIQGGRVRRAEGVDFSFYPQENTSRQQASLPASEEQPVEPPPPATEPDQSSTPEPGMQDDQQQHRPSQELSEAEKQQFMRDMFADEMGFNDAEAQFMFGPSHQSEAEVELGRTIDLILAFVVSAVLMLVILKLAFWVAGATLLFSEALVVASLYGVLQMIFAAVEWQLELRALFKVDDVLSFIALVLLIFHGTSVTQGLTALKLGVGCYVVSYVLNYAFLLLILLLIGSMM